MDFIETVIVAFASFPLVGGSLAYLSAPRAPLEGLEPTEGGERADVCKFGSKDCADDSGRDASDDDEERRDEAEDREPGDEDERGKGRGKD